MKNLISGMFSSVPDAQLLIATSGYEEDAPEDASDKFGGSGTDPSPNRTETNSSIDTPAGSPVNSSLDESIS
ncbi:MAG: hypothetical protein H6Q72_2358 [Firmicutes bacterium]|nr:hypothetical protein [Bacillota bacterium]